MAFVAHPEQHWVVFRGLRRITSAPAFVAWNSSTLRNWPHDASAMERLRPAFRRRLPGFARAIMFFT
ncbi:MAG TPA: hypothetical protein VNE42_02010, partial [Acidimicrobiales bacterium]|nr:hypothetical protein [Acidimicrobiales bacterium]